MHMGQAQASSSDPKDDPIPPQIYALHGKLQQTVTELKRIAKLSYPTFLKSIEEINEISSTFSDTNGKRLYFLLRANTDTTFLWRATVQIKCLKVNGHTGGIESCRILNLKQYVRLFNEVVQHSSAISNVSTSSGANDVLNTFNTSVILGEVSSSTESVSDECCICMDRRAEVILSCTHLFCEKCIDEWHDSHRTCPICRASVKNKDDSWVMPEKPDACEMAKEATGYLMGLADNTGFAECNSDSLSD